MEVTLSHVSLHTTEGHFCSLLKSNVILLTSPFKSTCATVNAILKTHRISSLGVSNYKTFLSYLQVTL